MSKRPRIAVIDMSVATNSPAGSCVLAEVRGLAQQFDVTVFSSRCDAADQAGVEFVKVPIVGKPVLARYISFQLMARLRVLGWRLRGGTAAAVQATQGQLPGSDIAYAHFCHRAYLNNQWRESTVTGVRRFARWANHQFNAFFEARAFARCQRLVVPSHGLARELTAQYPQVAERIVTIANPVALDRFARPAGHDRGTLRRSLGLEDGHVVLGFMALGDFARKGLGILIEALGSLPPAQRTPVRFLVIGGQAGEIESFKALAARHGVGEHLVFVGMQADVRPYLWAADVFAFPSAYEIFSLAILQAAAAGLPVLVSQGLYGAEEFVVDRHNGWQVARNPQAVAAWMQTMLAERDRLPAMAEQAVQSVQQYSNEAFVQRWTQLYAGMQAGGQPVRA